MKVFKIRILVTAMNKKKQRFLLKIFLRSMLALLYCNSSKNLLLRRRISRALLLIPKLIPLPLEHLVWEAIRVRSAIRERIPIHLILEVLRRLRLRSSRQLILGCNHHLTFQWGKEPF